MGKAFDAFSANKVAAKASEIVANGFEAVGLYYFHSSAFKELLTRDVAVKLTTAGLFVFSVYENGQPTSAAYFSTVKGNADAHVAEVRAVDAGQPAGTPIYFAVDYDAEPTHLSVITDYFTEVRRVLGVLGGSYTAGVYGSGLVCRHLSEHGLVSHTWLSQSTGFREFDTFRPHANIVQGPQKNLFNIDVDEDATNGNGGGWRIV